MMDSQRSGRGHLGPDAALAAANATAPVSASDDRYVLVVDDDEDIRTTIQQILEDDGFRALGAGNGEEAWALVEREPSVPRLILLDLMMPVMDGPRFHAKLRAHPRTSAVPVVVLSAGVELSQKAATMRAAGFLAKPVDLSTLVRTVRQWARS